MWTYWRGLLLIVSAVAVVGCSSSEVTAPDQAGGLSSALNGEGTDLSLAELFGKPRAELAALAEEWLDKVRTQQKGHHDGRLPYNLLPEFRLALIVPVCREARFTPDLGLSLPPYAEAGKKDNELALHLARYGDVEAALKLADPTDAEVQARIEACRYERNYPVEWTRLAGLLLHAAQVRVASGDPDGARDLVAFHRQVHNTLDPKAAKGPLGSVLLSSGRKTLTQAVAAWRETKKTELLELGEAGLKSWGQARAPELPFHPGSPRSEIARLLPGPSQGLALPAASLGRALDLLDLPLPGEGVQGVLALFDASDRLAEVLVTYRPRVSELYPDLAHLAQPLEEYGVPAQDAPREGGLHRRTYRVGEVTCKYTLVPGGNTVGAFVRFHDSQALPASPSLARSFGGAHLDRSFEQNRVRLTPEQLGDTLRTARAQAVAQVTNPLEGLRPTEIILEREKEHDLLARLQLHYPGDESAPPLHQAVLPLWAKHGPGRFEGVDDELGGHLALVWEDAQTRYTVKLPYAGGLPTELEVQDKQEAKDLAERAARAAALDRDERRARLAEGKPQVRLPRLLEAAWGLRNVQVQLGMTRDQVVQGLPGGQSVVQRDIPDGLRVAYTGEPGREQKQFVGEIVIRFDARQRAVEVRTLHHAGPAAKDSNWTRTLLNNLKKAGGAPQPLPATWASLWAELPPQKPVAALYSWRDDVTAMTYQCDGSVAECVLRDCPADPAAAVALPPLEALPRGPEQCSLGDQRGELLRRWGVDRPVTAGGGVLVLTPAKPSPYDALLVWFDKERIVRIVARHHPSKAGGNRSVQMGQAVTEAWGREARNLGWPQRRDVLSGDVLQGLGWHDERTRVRLFWEETKEGDQRVFTEWKVLTTL